MDEVDEGRKMLKDVLNLGRTRQGYKGCVYHCASDSQNTIIIELIEAL